MASTRGTSENSSQVIKTPVVTVMKKYLKHCFFNISDSIMIRTGKNGNVLVLRVV